ncbi:peptidylprolyl isomerase [Piscinibacterium candidicorallinum]|jgi:peptidyl-prolyl cis-trans isomerase A (cyclophilin A)|uniref:Peptidyl-prolyl cis-trans isomerase n=1 Tax=Piscinibacterium candidicorallinum TaxID=1793872 RepID=A0ABV7H3K0_9BURK
MIISKLFRQLAAVAFVAACAPLLAQTPTTKPSAGTSAAPQAASEAPRVQFKTSMGNITVELDAKAAPISVANFLRYVDDKHYDGTIFHRVIGSFMIQGGGFTPSMREKDTRQPIKLESGNGLSNVRGTIAMARTNVPDSATAQFFINVVDNLRLDKAQASDGNGYAVFGRVVEGMDTVDKIRAVQTTTRGFYQNVPETPVVIESARRVK